MDQVACCRTCLSERDLNPIFKNPSESQKYTNLLLNITGLKIHIDNQFPQTMCIKCINFINKYLRFRQQCHISHSTLLMRFKNINNSNLNDHDSDNDYADSHKNEDEEARQICPIKANFIEFEMSVEEALKRPNKVLIDNLMVKKKVKLKYEEVSVKKVSVEKTEGPWECKICRKTLKSKMSLKSHYKIHAARNIICEHCGKKFTTRRPLLMHCRAKHGYEKTDKCSYCDYRGCNAELVKIHERTHTGERPYACACGASFHRRSSYLQHRAIHLPEKTVPCPECPSMFKSLTLMRIHRSRHRRRAAPRAHPPSTAGDS